jgi:prepilin-type N-terminal cleavage/methylation domain-containing protein
MKARNLNYRRRGFTLVEVMLVAATLGLLATLAVPNYLRARKRAQAARLLDDLKAVDHAMVLYCVEFRRSGQEIMDPSDLVFLRRYLKDRIALYASLPNDMFNNPFVVSNLNTVPRLNGATYDELSDVVPLEYWNPYSPKP